MESALADVKSYLEANEATTLNVEELKTKTEALRQAAYKLAEEMYKNAQANASDGGTGAESQSEAQAGRQRERRSRLAARMAPPPPELRDPGPKRWKMSTTK